MGFVDSEKSRSWMWLPVDLMTFDVTVKGCVTLNVIEMLVECDW